MPSTIAHEDEEDAEEDEDEDDVLEMVSPSVTDKLRDQHNRLYADYCLRCPGMLITPSVYTYVCVCLCLSVGVCISVCLCVNVAASTAYTLPEGHALF